LLFIFCIIWFLALDLWIVKYYIGYRNFNLNFIGSNLLKFLGQLLVVVQSRLKEIQTLAHPELIPEPVENRTLGPAGSGISQRAAAARTRKLPAWAGLWSNWSWTLCATGSR